MPASFSGHSELQFVRLSVASVLVDSLEQSKRLSNTKTPNIAIPDIALSHDHRHYTGSGSHTFPRSLVVRYSAANRVASVTSALAPLARSAAASVKSGAASATQLAYARTTALSALAI